MMAHFQQPCQINDQTDYSSPVSPLNLSNRIYHSLSIHPSIFCIKPGLTNASNLDEGTNIKPIDSGEKTTDLTKELKWLTL